MHVLGVVAEYNPYHNGHHYQLHTAKKQTAADYAIVVLGGNFTQRGEPAQFSKWDRAKMALVDGADLVLELPLLSSIASAEGFAYGAIKILSATGIVDTLSFGSEYTDLTKLQTIAKLLVEEPKAYQGKLTAALSRGISYAKARTEALSYFVDFDTAFLSAPNTILALEYLKALIHQKSAIQPVAVERLYASYHDTEIHGAIASASALRLLLAKSNFSSLSSLVPEHVIPILRRAIDEGFAPVSPSFLSSLLQYVYRQYGAETFSQIQDMEEGLENRIARSLSTCYTREQVLAAIKTKRYPYTRLSRILLYCILQLQKQDFIRFQQMPTPPYLRVLGFRKESACLLKEITKKGAAPLLPNTKHASRILSADGQWAFHLECLATDLYAMGFPNAYQRKINLEYTMPVVLV